MKQLKPKDTMLGYELMKAYPNICCFSTTRHGGQSRGEYATFNCTHYCGDEAEDVAKNREMLCRLLSDEPITLVIPRQTHGTEVRVIENDTMLCEEESKALLEGVDALMTDVPHHCLCISTADCVPVLLYDPVHQAIAAIHAGWRGTVNRIVECVLTQMKSRYRSEGKDIIACIGPSISPEAFEVGDEVYEAFRQAGFDMGRIAHCQEKWHIDLWEANRLQLLVHGVQAENIEVCGICTYSHNDDFFSARRQGIKSGRILSGIMLSSWHSEERRDEESVNAKID